MFMNISAEAHCWVVTGISYSLFHLVTVIYDLRDKKGWTQRVGLANVPPKGLYHVMRG